MPLFEPGDLAVVINVGHDYDGLCEILREDADHWWVVQCLNGTWRHGHDYVFLASELIKLTQP